MSKNSNLDRRNFLKMVGSGAAAISLAGCKSAVSNSGVKEGVESEKIGELDYRISHNTKDRVSLLGFGCNRLETLDVPEADGYKIDQQATNEMVDYVMERGVNFFDTAPPYAQGWSERAMGAALSRYPRDKYFIATKLSNFAARLKTREGAIEMYKKSFESLQVDYIDYYLLHSAGGGGEAGFNSRFLDNGLLDFFVEEREAGRIRNFGFSYHGDQKTFDYIMSLHEKVRWDCAIIQLNYKDWNYANETMKNAVDASYLYAELDKRNINAIIMEPILGGRLANLPTYLNNMLLAERPNSSTASWGFRYAGSFPNVLCVLSGMTKYEHVRENVGVYSPLEKISERENDLLMDVATKMIEFPIVECSTCQYCMPCPYGVDIPSIFTHFNKCIYEGQYPQSTQDADYFKARREFLIGYDRAVPKLRQADHCIGCNKCTSHCPQSIDIPKQLRRVSAYVEALRLGDFDSVNSDEFVMMSIAEQLAKEEVSIVVANGEERRSFNRQGVVDLYDLVNSDSEFLKGALVADKVVGKGAAALMIYGGVKRVYAATISDGALELFFKESNVVVTYDKRVSHIQNQKKDGWCPVESLCKDDTKVEFIIPKIEKFIKEN